MKISRKCGGGIFLPRKAFTVFIYMVYMINVINVVCSFFIPWNNVDPSMNRIPLCRNCRYARPFPSIHNSSRLFSLENENSTATTYCSLFGEMNLLDGEVIYYPYSQVRGNESLCGIEGRYYHHYLSFDDNERELFSFLMDHSLSQSQS